MNADKMLINVGDYGGIADVKMAISPKFFMDPSWNHQLNQVHLLVEWSCVVVGVVSAEARPQFARLAEWRYAFNVCLSAGQSRSGSISAAVVYIPLE